MVNNLKILKFSIIKKNNKKCEKTYIKSTLVNLFNMLFLIYYLKKWY